MIERFMRRRRRRLLRGWRARRRAAADRSPAELPVQHVRGRHRAPTPDLAAPIRTLAARPSRAFSLVAASFTAAICVGLLFSPRVRVSGAEILGNQRIGDGALYAASELDGRAAVLIDASEAERRLEAHPQVGSAMVAVRLPARVRIVIEETDQVVRWHGGGGAVVIDEEGMVLAPSADARSWSGLPAVDSGDRPPPPVGTTLDAELLAAAREYGEAFGTLRWDPLYGFVVEDDSGWLVRLGRTPGRLSDQRATLDALRGQLGTAGAVVTLVDLRFPTRPYYRVRDGLEAP